MNTIAATKSAAVLSREGRSLTTSWTLEGTEITDSYGETSVIRLDVSTSHDKDRKYFRNSFFRVTVGGRFVRWAMELRNEDPCPISNYAVGTPRFNAKELANVHAELVAAAEAQLDDLIAWASRVKRDH